MAQNQAYYQVLKDQRFRLNKGEELTLDAPPRSTSGGALGSDRS